MGGQCATVNSQILQGANLAIYVRTFV